MGKWVIFVIHLSTKKAADELRAEESLWLIESGYPVLVRDQSQNTYWGYRPIIKVSIHIVKHLYQVMKNQTQNQSYWIISIDVSEQSLDAD